MGTSLKVILRKPRKLWKRPFLNVLRETGNITISADAAGVSTSYAHRARKRDPKFAAAWENAIVAAADYLVEEARRRAYEGVAEPVIWQGKICGMWIKDGKPAEENEPGAAWIPLVIRKYSDPLLMFLIRAQKPEYKSQTNIEVTGKNGGPIEQTVKTEVARRTVDYFEVLKDDGGGSPEGCPVPGANGSG